MLFAGAAQAADACPKPALPEMVRYWALALTWQPGFCESRDADKLPRECAWSSRMTSLTLHGLWPQGEEYCERGLPAQLRPDYVRLVQTGCSGDRRNLPVFPLSAEVSDRLAKVMPGMASRLQDHEYLKHGTCSGMTPDAYFTLSTQLVDKVNGAGLGRFLRDRAGQEIRVAELCQAIGQAFGAEAVRAVEGDWKQVTFKGEKRRMLVELRLWLQADGTALDVRPANFVAVQPGWPTLGSRGANPLCDNEGNVKIYIDKPGMGE